MDVEFQAAILTIFKLKYKQIYEKNSSFDPNSLHKWAKKTTTNYENVTGN